MVCLQIIWHARSFFSAAASRPATFVISEDAAGTAHRRPPRHGNCRTPVFPLLAKPGTSLLGAAATMVGRYSPVLSPLRHNMETRSELSFGSLSELIKVKNESQWGAMLDVSHAFKCGQADASRAIGARPGEHPRRGALRMTQRNLAVSHQCTLVRAARDCGRRCNPMMAGVRCWSRMQKRS